MYVALWKKRILKHLVKDAFEARKEALIRLSTDVQVFKLQDGKNIPLTTDMLVKFNYYRMEPF